MFAKLILKTMNVKNNDVATILNEYKCNQISELDAVTKLKHLFTGSNKVDDTDTYNVVKAALDEVTGEFMPESEDIGAKGKPFNLLTIKALIESKTGLKIQNQKLAQYLNLWADRIDADIIRFRSAKGLKLTVIQYK
jgi:hypothetical protein